MLYCLVLIAGLCFSGHHVKAEVSSLPFGYAVTVTADRYKVETAASDVIQMHDFRKAPKACQGDVCVRYHKFCAPKDGKIHCFYRVIWPGIVPDGTFRVDADDGAALALAEQETAIMVHRDNKEAKLPLTALSVLAKTETLADCPPDLGFNACDPP